METHKGKIIALVVVVALLLIGWTIYEIVKAVKQAKAMKDSPDYTQDLDPQTGALKPITTQAILDGYNPEPLAIELNKVLSSTWLGGSGRCTAYYKACMITSNQLVAVAHRFQKLHSQNLTLRQAIEQTYFDGCVFYDPDNDWGETLRARLDAAKIP